VQQSKVRRSFRHVIRSISRCISESMTSLKRLSGRQRYLPIHAC